MFITINIDRTLEAIAVICKVSLGAWGKRRGFWWFVFWFWGLGFFWGGGVCFFLFILYPLMQSPAASLGADRS